MTKKIREYVAKVKGTQGEAMVDTYPDVSGENLIYLRVTNATNAVSSVIWLTPEQARNLANEMTRAAFVAEGKSG